MKKNWWKFLGAALVFYSVIAGLLNPVPRLDILNESIRNLYFHVPMWFSMIAMLTASFVMSIIYLGNQKKKFDIRATEFTYTGMMLGLFGILTGMIWAQFTWGFFWTNDPKLNGVAIGMLIYAGYYILRQAIEDHEKRARVSAVFNIFAYPIFVVLIFVLPRINDSLHPGNGGNPGFSKYDLDDGMRMVFYPAVLGWILIGTWIATLRTRIKKLELHEELEDE
ncbi:MAG: ABC transporter permease [Bacteroidetes bacterium]|nr:ABC transporter permease [Bacteroidota bacterium]